MNSRHLATRARLKSGTMTWTLSSGARLMLAKAFAIMGEADLRRKVCPATDPSGQRKTRSCEIREDQLIVRIMGRVYQKYLLVIPLSINFDLIRKRMILDWLLPFDERTIYNITYTIVSSKSLCERGRIWCCFSLPCCSLAPSVMETTSTGAYCSFGAISVADYPIPFPIYKVPNI